MRHVSRQTPAVQWPAKDRALFYCAYVVTVAWVVYLLAGLSWVADMLSVE